MTSKESTPMREQRTCTEDGCDQPHLARGLCRKHYGRWQRSRPEYREKDLEGSRRRRKTSEYRAVDRERQRRRRRKNGVQLRRTKAEIEQEWRARRRAARWRAAQAKLDRAASGVGRSRIWTAGPCPGCGELFVAWSAVCSKTCQKRLDRWADRDAYGNHRERARRHGVAYESVRVEAIMERDGWRCQLCGIQTEGVWPSQTSPSLDHIVPMARGGAHTWDNLQCACLACNIRKGASVGGEEGEGTVQQLTLSA